MLTYAEVIEKVKAAENGIEMVDVLLSEQHKRNGENQSLRQRLKEYDGLDAVKARTVIDKLREHEIDPDGDIDTQLQTLKSKPIQSDSELQSVKKQLEKLKLDIEAERTEKQKIEKQAIRERLAAKLAPKFSEYVHNGEIALDYHLDKGSFTVNESGSIVFRVGDDVAAEGTVDDVIKTYVERFPAQAKNVQRGGSESNPGTKQSSVKVMKKSEFDKLQPKARAEYVVSGGAVED